MPRRGHRCRSGRRHRLRKSIVLRQLQVYRQSLKPKAHRPGNPQGWGGRRQPAGSRRGLPQKQSREIPSSVGASLLAISGSAASIASKLAPTKRAKAGQAFFISQPVSSASALPMSARERTVFTPASCSAANFSSAVPLPPEMIAPAWPIRLPAGAVTPAM